MAFVVGLLVVGLALWFLWRTKQQDLVQCGLVLGLQPVPQETTRGTTPEGFTYTQTRLMNGSIDGHPARLSVRTVGVRKGSVGRRRGSQFTVLDLTRAIPAGVALRLQPAGMLGGLEEAMRGPVADRVPIDSVFDEAYVVFSAAPSNARSVLTPDLRAALLAFRARFLGENRSSAGARLASALVLGTFQLDGANASYVLFGSPTKAVAEHLKLAAPLLIELAGLSERTVRLPETR